MADNTIRTGKDFSATVAEVPQTVTEFTVPKKTPVKKEKPKAKAEVKTPEKKTPVKKAKAEAVAVPPTPVCENVAAHAIKYYTEDFSEKGNGKFPITIEGYKGAGGGMRYAVDFKLGDKVPSMGITKALQTLGFIGFSLQELRFVCNANGQPEIRDSVIASYAGAGASQARGNNPHRPLLTDAEIAIANRIKKSGVLEKVKELHEADKKRKEKAGK